MNSLNLVVPLMYMIMITTMVLMLWNNFHPTHLILMLIMYSLMICMYMNLSMLKKTFLFSIIVFLIMISGVLIIFLYFSSLISNEKVDLKITKKMIIMTVMFTSSTMLILNLKKLNQPINTSMEMITMIQLHYDMFSNIKWIYLYPYNSMTTISVIFLILWMFLIIKIIPVKSINLRKINYE